MLDQARNNKELFINPRAQALGNEQLHKQTAIVEAQNDLDPVKTAKPIVCNAKVCRTTWKPIKK